MKLSRLIAASLVGVAAAAVSISSCCRWPDLRLGDFESRLDMGFEAAAKVEFDLGMEFDLKEDLGSWSDVEYATQANTEYDTAGKRAFRTRIDADMDDDGIEESVDMIAFDESGPSSLERVFAAWEGDKYSFDKNKCYLLWWRGATVEILSATCKKREPAVHCTMLKDQPESMECESCGYDGDCTFCSTDYKFDTCRNLTESDGGGGGGGVEISKEWSLCVQQVGDIASEARQCDMSEPLDPEILCKERLSDVNICFGAFETADLFGQNTCAVLRNDSVCGDDIFGGSK